MEERGYRRKRGGRQEENEQERRASIKDEIKGGKRYREDGQWEGGGEKERGKGERKNRSGEEKLMKSHKGRKELTGVVLYPKNSKSKIRTSHFVHLASY